MGDVRVLVTGTGHLGVGEGIVHCLRAAGRRYRILAGNADPRASALFSCDAGYLLPHASDGCYLAAVEGLCRKESVSFLIPGSEAELRILSEAHERFSRFGCSVLASARSVIDTASDKFQTHQFLRAAGFPTPDSLRHPTSEQAEALGWPLVIKPVCGGGSRHVSVVSSREEFEATMTLMRMRGIDVLAQRCIGTIDEEYTASALLDPAGRVIGSFAAKRRLVGGATAWVEVEDFREIRDLALQVAVRLGATGPVNIQLRVGEAGPSIFEINPRFSGSAPFRAACGFNEPDLLIRSIIAGAPVSWGPPSVGVVGVREFRETIVSRDAISRIRRIDE